MYGQHSARWIVLFVTTLIGGALLQSLPAMAAGRKPPAATGLPPGIDIAIERPANGSSETTGQPATNAVDGDATTHWCPGAGTSDAQLTVSLDRLQQLNGTGVTWVGRAPAWYQVELSADGRHWRPLHGTRSAADSLTSFDRITGHASPARFARLSFSDSSGVPCVAEFRVYASPHSAAGLIRGADVSTLRALETAGKSFSDAAGTRPAERILADHGMNLVRLRLWVDPPNGFNDLADVAAMARRIKQAHMQFLLDLHYSDFWADPGHQDTPAAWQGQDLATLAVTVHDYTRSVVATLMRQGTPPQIIQIGNEVTAGMLWPQGQLYVGNDQRWVEFTTLLKAGIAGAREGAPRSQRPAIMLHIDRGGDQGGAQWFYDHMRDYNVDFDQIGLSYYPYWHGSLSDLRRNLDNLAARYAKPIVVVETAYAWTFDDHDNYPNIVGPSFNLPPEYPATPEGQALFIRDLLSVVARTPGKLGHGVVYWEPAWIPGVGWKPGEGNAWDNQTLFDAQGHSLESINAMQP
jgi:arabinogalactan endo-1,4-beta-galactosidase